LTIMKFRPAELELARSYTEITPLAGLSREQCAFFTGG